MANYISIYLHGAHGRDTKFQNYFVKQVTTLPREGELVFLDLHPDDPEERVDFPPQDEPPEVYSVAHYPATDSAFANIDVNVRDCDDDVIAETIEHLQLLGFA